jgi:hypothetical protein
VSNAYDEHAVISTKANGYLHDSADITVWLTYRTAVSPVRFPPHDHSHCLKYAMIRLKYAGSTLPSISQRNIYFAIGMLAVTTNVE